MNCEYLHAENNKIQFRQYISEHLGYKTIVYLESDKGIVAACRFNVNNHTASILDAAVDKQYRGRDMLMRMLRLGLKLYPSVKKLAFHSDKKNKDYIFKIGDWSWEKLR